MLAIVGVFLGGAGIVMIAAGHLIASTSVLVAVGAVSAVYLVWFLGFGPGAAKAPELRVTSRRGAPAPFVADPTFSAEPMTCSLCGADERDPTRVVATARAVICAECIEAAIPELGAHRRGGMEPSRMDLT